MVEMSLDNLTEIHVFFVGNILNNHFRWRKHVFDIKQKIAKTQKHCWCCRKIRKKGRTLHYINSSLARDQCRKWHTLTVWNRVPEDELVPRSSQNDSSSPTDPWFETNFKDRLRKESGRDYIKLTMYPEMTKSFSLTPSQTPDSPSFTRWGPGIHGPNFRSSDPW